MALGEKMTRLVPNSHMGWHCRAWAAEEYGAMAKGWDAAVKATADDDKEHKVTFLYRYTDAILRRGHFRIGDIRKLYMEARQLEGHSPAGPQPPLGGEGYREAINEVHPG